MTKMMIKKKTKKKKKMDSDPKRSRPYWHFFVVPLETDAVLAKPVSLQ
jgi:hypothetical protein